MVVSYRVVLTVTQTSSEGVHCKETSDYVYYVCFYVSSVLSYLVVDRICELLGLGHYRSMNFAVFSQIFFGIFVARERSHSKVDYLISILVYSLQ